MRSLVNRNSLLSMAALVIAVVAMITACGSEPPPGGGGGGNGGGGNGDVDEAQFSVEIDAASSTVDVDEGDTVEVVATVENTGDALGTQDIQFEIAGAADATEEAVELEVGESETFTFDWMTAAGDAGSYSAQVSSDDDTASIDVTVAGDDNGGDENGDDVFFAVEIDQNESVLEAEVGEDLDFVNIIQNTGEDTGTQELSAEINGQPLQIQGAEPITLNPGEAAQLSLQLPTEAEGEAMEPGEYTFTALTEDDQDTVDFTVLEGDDNDGN